MCRVLIYLGSQSIPLKDLLFGPDNSLIKQSYDPKLMKSIQNLAGFGMALWNNESSNPEKPFYYKTTELPFFDKNLEGLCEKLRVNCLLSHVRGVDYGPHETVVRPNVHPYKLPDAHLALAHNGSVSEMAKMKPELLKYIKPEVAQYISGTTDSEWIYSVFVSQFEDPNANVSLDEAWDALIQTFKIFREVRVKLGIVSASPVNVFVTNGQYVVVTRFVFDYGLNTDAVEEAFLEYHSLWFTYGEDYGLYDGMFKMQGSEIRRNIILASEPLTVDKTTWIEVPEYSIARAWLDDDRVHYRSFDLNV